MPAWIAARTQKLILSTATTLITTNVPVKIARTTPCTSASQTDAST